MFLSPQALRGAVSRLASPPSRLEMLDARLAGRATGTHISAWAGTRHAWQVKESAWRAADRACRMKEGKQGSKKGRRDARRKGWGPQNRRIHLRWIHGARVEWRESALLGTGPQNSAGGFVGRGPGGGAQAPLANSADQNNFSFTLTPTESAESALCNDARDELLRSSLELVRHF